jgi:hypothetical protein
MSNTNYVELTAAINHVMAKVAKPDDCRDELTAGAAYRYDLTVSGTIEGNEFTRSHAGTLTVGHTSERATNSVPYAAIVGSILGKLNAKTRESVLASILSDYATTKTVSASDEHTQAADELFAALRQTVKSPCRGAVKCQPATATEPVVFANA